MTRYQKSLSNLRISRTRTYCAISTPVRSGHLDKNALSASQKALGACIFQNFVVMGKAPKSFQCRGSHCSGGQHPNAASSRSSAVIIVHKLVATHSRKSITPRQALFESNFSTSISCLFNPDRNARKHMSLFICLVPEVITNTVLHDSQHGRLVDSLRAWKEPTHATSTVRIWSCVAWKELHDRAGMAHRIDTSHRRVGKKKLSSVYLPH